MPQTIEQKQERFGRVFPERVEKLVKTVELITNCSNKSNYDWAEDTVKKTWVHLLIKVSRAANAFGLNVSFTVNGIAAEDLYLPGSPEQVLN